MIKYLGSKRRLISVLGAVFERVSPRTALDLFTGTTRVAQEFKRRGAQVTTVDSARYSEIFAQCYIATDATDIDLTEVQDALAHLNSVPGIAGYFTETFCHQSRYFQPFNGRRIDAIRDLINDHYRDTWLHPVLLTALIEAADRVDSTTGVQMAYIKQWSARSFTPLKLRMPELLTGPGNAIRGDALNLLPVLNSVDLAYLDPPYNQHRYYTNYHIWETLVAWDRPEYYGIACKRIDSRDDTTKSIFNKRREMPSALAHVIQNVKAKVIVISYNNESWIQLEQLVEMCRVRGRVKILAFDSKRYVGAQIGIHNLSGIKVGRVSHLRNLEYILIVQSDQAG